MKEADIRNLTLPEVRQLLDWAEVERWNPGIDDAEPFFATDPNGFFGCFINDRMASAISAVRYGHDFGFIGLYISDPDFRGKGLGKRIWDHGMRYLEGRAVGLDGVPQQQENYARMGFKPRYNTIRWSGSLAENAPTSAGIIALDPLALSQIAGLDRRAFPAGRASFLRSWINSPRHALGIMEHGILNGYGVLRACHAGFKVGPLFAETIDQAIELFAALCQLAAGETVHIDVPENQDRFSRHLESLGFTQGFTTTRMYRGVPPRLEERLSFGVTTLELG